MPQTTTGRRFTTVINQTTQHSTYTHNKLSAGVPFYILLVPHNFLLSLSTFVVPTTTPLQRRHRSTQFGESPQRHPTPNHQPRPITAIKQDAPPPPLKPFPSQTPYFVPTASSSTDWRTTKLTLFKKEVKPVNQRLSGLPPKIKPRNTKTHTPDTTKKQTATSLQYTATRTKNSRKKEQKTRKQKTLPRKERGKNTMARVTSPRPSTSGKSVADFPKKHFIRISAEKMRWYKAQEAREREFAAAARRSGSAGSASSSSGSSAGSIGSPFARRVRISFKRRDSS